jgi:hypothetical protein
LRSAPHDGTTPRRHDVTTKERAGLAARATKSRKDTKNTKAQATIGGSELAATPAYRPALTGVRVGQITSGLATKRPFVICPTLTPVTRAERERRQR